MAIINGYNERLIEQELEINEPQYSCGSCTRCNTDSECSFFNRPVDKRNNKCFHHEKR